jgi:type IV pilus biogenesis protein CpaD/CtpE
MRNRPLVCLVALVMAETGLAGCSSKDSMGREEVRSEIRSAESFAAESEMFIDFVLEGHATRGFAEGHAGYLEDEIQQLAKELENAAPEPDAARSAGECRTQLDRLTGELSGIRAAISDRSRLAAAKVRISQIRESLDKANP